MADEDIKRTGPLFESSGLLSSWLLTREVKIEMVRSQYANQRIRERDFAFVPGRRERSLSRQTLVADGQ